MLLPVFSFAGKADLKKALFLYNSGYYGQALKIYENEGQLKEKNLIRLGFCYYKTNYYERAENTYERIYRDYTDVDSIRLTYADVLIRRSNPKKAIEVLAGCKYKTSDQYKNLEAIAIYSRDNFESKSRAEIKETDINPSGINLGLSPTQDGMLTSVVDNKTGEYTLGYVDFYASEVHTIEPLKLFNTKKFKGGVFVGNPSLDDNGNVYFCSSYSNEQYYTKGNRDKRGFNSRGENKLLLYKGEYSNGKVNGIESLPFCSNDYNFITPYIDGDRLYFASDLPGGFGGYDIYVCTKEASGWSKPRNLGEKVNSVGDEMYPFRDEGKFYYASNGLPGYGGSDIFFSSINNGSYSSPVNLGYGINSCADDFSFCKSTMEGEYFFISNRNNSFGLDQVYQMKNFSLLRSQETMAKDKITKENISIDGVTLKNENGTNEALGVIKSDGKAAYDTPLSGTYNLEFYSEGYQRLDLDESNFQENFSLKELEFDPNYSGRVVNMITGETMPGARVVAIDENGNVIKETYADENGNWYLAAPDRDGVRLLIESDQFKTDTLSAADWVGKDINSFMAPAVVKGTKIEIRNIYFEYAKADISPESYNILDNILKYLNQNPEVRIELSAHTDSRGTDRANASLSQRRAQTAYDYLVARGIEKSRLVAKGYGESSPVNKCVDGVDCSEEEHQMNRRVEMKVL